MEELNDMQYYMLTDMMKDVVKQTIDTNGKGLPDDVKELTAKVVEEVIDNSRDNKQMVIGLLTFITTIVLNNSCKLLHDKWLKEM